MLVFTIHASECKGAHRDIILTELQCTKNKDSGRQGQTDNIYIENFQRETQK